MFFHHVRYAFRLLRKSPGFTAAALLTLALGIGANTTVFTIVDSVILRPLPFGDPDRLVALWERLGGRDEPLHAGGPPMHFDVSPANLVDYNDQSRSFDGLAGYSVTSKALTRSGPPEQVMGEAVTWNYFQVLGVQPAMGRAFAPEDDRQGARHVVILSDALWRGRFAQSPSILGQRIVLDDGDYEVVGVMPRSFEGVSDFQLPLSIRFFVPAYAEGLRASRGNHNVKVVGRIKRGMSAEQAQSDLDAISTRLAHDFPRNNSDVRAMIAPLALDLTRNIRQSLLILVGAVALVLIIACVNVANLLLVRAVGQRRTIAIQMALGATRATIVAELLVRGLILGALGGAAGLVCAAWTKDLVLAIAPATIPRLETIAINPRVLVITFIVSVASGLMAAVVPAFQVSADTHGTLKDTGLSVSATRSVMRWRGMLVAGEMGAAVVLAVGAGLLVRSLVRLNRVPLGFETGRVLVMGINLPDTRYASLSDRVSFFDRLGERVRAIPGVVSTAFADEFPLRGMWGSDFRFAGPSGPIKGSSGFQIVDASYFATLGIPVVRGRSFEATDRTGSLPVAIVSETFVRTFLTAVEPIGLRLEWNLGSNAPPLTIVGVVGEIRRGGKAAAPSPELYLAASQTDLPLPAVVKPKTFAVRVAGDAGALTGAIQKSVWAIDPEQPINGVQTLDETLSASLAERRFNLAMLMSFAGLALGLALIGCYGVVAYAAAQRTREIGIRVAFGASRRDVVALIVKSGMWWTGVGVAAGVAAAFALTRIMRSLLFEITPTDSSTFLVVVAAVIGVALVASYLPARRAARISPIEALRTE